MSHQNGKEIRFEPILKKFGFSEDDITAYWQRFYHSSMKYDALHARNWLHSRKKEREKHFPDFDDIESDFSTPPSLDDQHTNTGSTGMNINHSITALQDFNTVGVRFTDTNKVYTYKTSEDFTEGDHAVVCPSGILKIVQIVRVDDTPQIDFGSNVEYKWIVQRVSTVTYDTILDQEEQMAIQLRKTIANSKRKEVKEALLAEIGTEGQAKILAIMGGTEE